MKDITDERSTPEKPFSFQKMKFRYELAKRLLPEGLILDLGCGNGYEADFFKANSYSGFDYYKGAIDEARKNYFSHSFEVCKFPEGLSSYKEQFYDNIICCELIEHLDLRDGLSLLKEIHKILKPKGHLFLSTPVARAEITYKNHAYEYSKEEMKVYLLKNGFQIIKSGGYFNPCLINLLRKLRGEKKSEAFSLRTKNPRTKLILKIVGFISIWLGYLFPNTAHHQWYLCQKIGGKHEKI